MSTTVAAAGILLFMVLGASNVSHDKYGMIAYYVPRVSTAAFVDIFAFFFLKLYKSTIDEERFYQNELTARTARQIALYAASNLKEETAIGRLAENFSLLNQNKSVAMNSTDGSANLEEIVKIIDSATKVLSTVAQKKGGVTLAGMRLAVSLPRLEATTKTAILSKNKAISCAFSALARRHMVGGSSGLKPRPLRHRLVTTPRSKSICQDYPKESLELI